MRAEMDKLNGVHGTLYVERDLSLGHYRLRLGPIRLFWKGTPGWEANFISDDGTLGFQVITLESLRRLKGEG